MPAYSGIAAIGELPGISQLPVLHQIGFLGRIPLLRKLIPLTGRMAWATWLFVHITSLLGPRNKMTVMMGLVARYGVRLHRAPVPIVGDVPAIRPSKAERRSLSSAQQAAVDAAVAEDDRG